MGLAVRVAEEGSSPGGGEIKECRRGPLPDVAGAVPGAPVKALSGCEGNSVRLAGAPEAAVGLGVSTAREHEHEKGNM